MVTRLSKEMHEVGYQASAEVLKKGNCDLTAMAVQIVTIRQGLQQANTAEELLGFVKGASKAMSLNHPSGYCDIVLLKTFLRAYLDGVYDALGLENPLRVRSI